MSHQPSMRGKVRQCDRCGYQRMNALFRPKTTICNLCAYGVYRAATHEYSTTWNMGLATAAARVKLTRIGIMAAMQRASLMTPLTDVRAIA